ncbi:MAG: hypothetical protein AB1512_27185 [Thermodesulfobacteriota bacterium]
MKTNLNLIVGVGPRAVAMALALVYYTAFVSCYYYVISPTYDYYGMTLTSLPGWCWAASLVLALLPVTWMPVRLKRPSDFASWFLYLCLISPSIFVSLMVSSRPLDERLILPAWLTASFLLFEAVRQRGRFVVPRIKGPAMMFSILLPLAMVGLSILILSYADYRFDLSLSDSYERRMEARDILQGRILLGYLLALLQSVFIPTAMIYGVHRRRWSFVALAFLSAAAIFSLEGSKAPILLPVALGAVVILARKEGIRVGYWLPIALTMLVLFALAEAALLETNYVAALVVRRLMAMPGLLTTYYWEYFSQNPYYMMSDSIVGGLLPFETLYKYPRSRLIGDLYFGDSEVNANANIWASGFADFGYLGMAFVSISAALFLKVIDSLCFRDKVVAASACAAAVSLVWVNSALHTSLLTGGALGLVLVLWLYPGEHWRRRRRAGGDLE